MMYFQLLSTIFVAAVIVIAYPLIKNSPLDELGFGLKLDKMKIKCKVPCRGGHISKTCSYETAQRCVWDLQDGCNPPKK